MVFKIKIRGLDQNLNPKAIQNQNQDQYLETNNLKKFLKISITTMLHKKII